MYQGQGIIDEEALNIFTDGSSFPNKKRAAGVGVHLVWVNEEGDEECSDYAPTGWKSATIDEMEIEACIVALREAQSIFTSLQKFTKIIIFTDSLYVSNNFTNAMRIWPMKKWHGNNNMPVKNIELWKKLRKEVNKAQIRVDVQWVKAHKTNKHNKTADKLAKESASRPFNKPLSISETTKKWSDRKTKRGCIPITGQETKIRIISRKSIEKTKFYEYRYEIIDPDDKNYKDVDFVLYDKYLNRNKCFNVLLNKLQSKPFIVSLISELDSSKYKY